MKKIINPVPGWGLHDSQRAGGWHHAAIRVGDLIFLSGVIGVYPGTKKLAPTVDEQVRLIFQHLRAGLEAHGASLQDIVQMTLFFTDRKAQWPVLDRIRRELFPKDPPTSTGVGVTELDLGAAVEVNTIAAVAEG
jgi:2-iminobutanoate/2-iminopropanoate deaminase